MCDKTDEVEYLYHKIISEGGITEYIIHYGGEVPPELQKLADNLEKAYIEFKGALQELYKRHNVGGY